MDKETEDKLKQIGSMFGITEIPDNIGDILETLMSSKSEESVVSESKSNSKESPDIDIDADTLKLITTLKRSFDSNRNDNKARLLKALAPFLSDTKQAKVNNCIKLMTFAELAKNKDILGLWY